MRITENMLTSTLLYNLSKGQGRLGVYQTQLATSKRIHKPSDDPVGSVQGISLRSSLSRIEQYLANIDDASTWLSATESALNDVESSLTRARTLASRGASDSMGQDARTAIAQEIGQLIDQLLMASRTTFKGQHIFSGTNTTTAPYIAAQEVTGEAFMASLSPVQLSHGGLVQGSVKVTTEAGAQAFVEGEDYTVDYEEGTITILEQGRMTEGDTYQLTYQTQTAHRVTLGPERIGGEIQRQISDDMFLTVNVSGDEVFGADQETFQALIDLKDRLYKNDGSAIREAMDALDVAIDRVLNMVATVGAKTQRLEMTRESLQQLTLSLTGSLSEVEDTDIPATMIQAQTQENALIAALKTGAQYIQRTFIDLWT